MSSLQKIIMCGYCNKVLDKKSRKLPTFNKSCVLCNDNKILHQKCALKFYNNSHHSDKSSKVTRISIDSFETYKKDFYCAQCQQLECLVCHKPHPHSKLSR